MPLAALRREDIMKKRACFLVGLGFALVLFFLTASAGTSILCVDPGAGEAAKLPARMGTSQHLSAMEGRPAERLSAQGVLEYSCPLTPTTSPVWWDIPPQSGSVVVSSSGEEFIQPGPDDEVRVIIQLEGEPVSAYKSCLKAVPAPLTNAESDQIRDYASELRRSHQQLVSKIKAQGIELEVRREYSYIFNGLAASIKMADMKRIETLPGVKGVYPDYEVHALLDESVPLIGAPGVWAMTDANGQSVTGRGIHVAVIDTGIDYTHPDLGGCLGSGCKVVGGYDFVNGDADPMDDRGHGTHVAGIVAANGTVKGVAPDASLHGYKVLNEYGVGWDSDIIAAIERAVDADGDPTTDDAVDIINMSLGGHGDPDDPLALAVDAAVGQGVLVVVAAGNDGPEYGRVGSPGVARKAFTVGATDEGDIIADFSSRGPVPNFYELIKPDIIAPGAVIYSTYLDGSHDWNTGTSMAAPHVAGAAALIKQLHPAWTPAMIQANLMNTAKDLSLDAYTQGAGRVQVDHAASAQAILSPGSMSFGLVDVDQPLWTKTKTLRLTNVAPTSVTYSLQISGTLPTGVTASLSPANMTLAAGEGVTVSVSITVDNALLPYQTEGLGSHQAQVIVQPAAQGLTGHQSTAESLVAPFTFIKSPRLEMTFMGGGNPFFVIVHNGQDVWKRYPDVSCTLLLPPATYDIWVYYWGDWVIREGVVVSKVTRLSISPSEAVHTITLAPRDRDGRAISPEYRSLQETFKHTTSGISTTLASWGSPGPSFLRRFSEVSADYTWEWRLNTTWTDDWYEFNDTLTGIFGDSIYQNDPASLRHVAYQFHPGPAHPSLQVRHQAAKREFG